jgi:predicted small metal-binding protein
MAKTISCRDVGVDCDFVAKADTLDELMQMTAQHAKDAHGFDTIPADMVPAVQAAIRDV